MRKENRRLSAKSRAKIEEAITHGLAAVDLLRELLASDDEDKAQDVLHTWSVADARL